MTRVVCVCVTSCLIPCSFQGRCCLLGEGVSPTKRLSTTYYCALPTSLASDKNYFVSWGRFCASVKVWRVLTHPYFFTELMLSQIPEGWVIATVLSSISKCYHKISAKIAVHVLLTMGVQLIPSETLKFNKMADINRKYLLSMPREM